MMAMRIMQSVRSAKTGDNGIEAVEAVAASLTNHAAAESLNVATGRNATSPRAAAASDQHRDEY
jgi:hypothetical protein